MLIVYDCFNLGMLTVQFSSVSVKKIPGLSWKIEAEPKYKILL